MLRRFVPLLVGAALAVALVTPAVMAQDAAKPKIAFLPGIEDPFYHVMETGIDAAAADFGVDIVKGGYPPDPWGAASQTPLLDALVARGDLDYIVTAPTSATEMVAPLQAALEGGTKIVTVDTYLGDGDYSDGHDITFPISYIGSDNLEGGRFMGHAMAKALGEKGEVYIQNTNADASSVADRSKGFREAIAQYPGMEVVDEQYSGDVESVAAQQTAAVLDAHPNLAGIFGVNVRSAQGAGTSVANAGLGGQVQVAAWDATKKAIELLRSGEVQLVLAQKPFDMGYLGVAFAMADAKGVTSLPTRVTTGFQVITADNVDDPEVARFIYQTP